MDDMLMISMVFIDDKNDRKFFEKIYNSYRKQMFLYAKDLLHNTDEAEDAVDSVFCRIAERNLRAVQSIENNTDLRNYLLKVTKNTVLNMIDKKERQRKSIDSVAENESTELTDEEFIRTVCVAADYKTVGTA